MKAVEISASEAMDSHALINTLSKSYPDHAICERSYFKLLDNYINNVFDCSKTTTIRYSPNKLEYPTDKCLPLIKVETNKNLSKEELIGDVLVTRLCYKAFGDLDECDALNDGFASEQDLKNELRRIYGDIKDREMVSIFFIAPHRVFESE
ncbi:ASCH domain-containing protein [Methylobacterium dankookense]|uniref:ASCH domain-containing protein n=1 Tax=Methylobacterium dankookense TaxID=560405 RepID=UPI0011A7432B|nr:ASCH domain-containing protein [Methylobacterium dankookense]